MYFAATDATSAADVASSLRRYQELGVTHFVLSDTPYLREIRRQGEQLLPLLRGPYFTTLVEKPPGGVA